MTIKIRDLIKGDTAVSYDDGRNCYKLIEPAINQKETVILDFEGIDYVITAFLNPIIGDLILQKGLDVMKLIQIKNANSKTIEKIKMVKDGALLKREDIE